MEDILFPKVKIDGISYPLLRIYHNIKRYC